MKRNTNASNNLPPLDPKQRYTMEEAADYLRVSVATVYNFAAARTINVIKEGRRTYVPGSEIVRLSQLPPDTPPPVPMPSLLNQQAR